VVIAAIALIGHGPIDGMTSLKPLSQATILGDRTPRTESDPDTRAVELGLRFRTDTAGSVLGVRFYKSAANTGPHDGRLWDDGGRLLAAATFAEETADGWQEVRFDSPVPVSAGTTYVASYHTGTGHYAADAFFFHRPTRNGSLTALNSVYAYGDSPTFPTSNWLAANYWVDVLFTESLPDPDTPPPGGGTVPPESTTTTPPTSTTTPTTTTPNTTTTTTPVPTTSVPTTSVPTTSVPTTSVPTTTTSTPNTTTSTTSTSTTTRVPVTVPPATNPPATTTPEPPPPPPDGGNPGGPYVGFPGDANTGVPLVVALRPSGSVTVDGDGTVIDGLDVTGCIDVRASNVVIRNTRVRYTGGCGSDVVRLAAGAGNLVVQDSDLDGQSHPDCAASVGSSDYTLVRVDMHHCSDGPRVSETATVVVRDSYIHELSNLSGDHGDGIQCYRGTGPMTIAHNTIQGGSNAAFMTADYCSGALRFDGNLLLGGGYSLRLYDNSATVTNNVFVKGTARYGPVDVYRGPEPGNADAGATIVAWSNNRLADNADGTGLAETVNPS
jgi:hypothetical protein